MVLMKRYFRNIKENLSLYVSTILLTILSLLLFFLYYISGSGILNYKNDFFKSQNIEDATFQTYLEIPEEKINNLENNFNVIIEKQRYINIDTNGIRSRIFEQANKVNIEKVVEGRNILNRDEIIISRGYAVENNISLNSIINIKDKAYKIVGFMERPDYLYMLENISDSYKNVNSFYLAYLHEDEFNALDGKNIEYHIIFNEDNIKEFRHHINDTYKLSFYLNQDDNFRITMVRDQPDLFIKMAYITLFTVPLIVVILISIMLSRKIRSEQKMIGTLSAFGYTKSKIIWHYCGYSILPGVIGGILTVIVVGIVAKPYGSLGLMDYEPLLIDFKLDPLIALLGIVVPTFMYILSTFLTVGRLLRNDTTILLQGNAGNKNKVKKFFVEKNVSLRVKFSFRSIIGNFGRSFVLLLGSVLGTFVVLFGFIMRDSMINLAEDNKDILSGYNYQYVLNELHNENPYGGETLLMVTLEDSNSKNIQIYGADGTTILELKDEDGKKITNIDGYIATSLFATTNKIKIGDEIKVYNPLNLEEYEITITNICLSNSLNAIYTTRENVSKITDIPADYYNVIISLDSLNIDQDKQATYLSKDTINEKFETIFNTMDVLVFLVIGVGIILCVIAVFIAVNMVINENRSTISMLRVLGYDDKSIGKLMLRDYIIIIIIGIILGLPLAYFSSKILFLSFVDILGYIIPVKANIIYFIFTMLLVLVSYYVSLMIVSRKIKNVDMVESLKDNRE